MLKTLLDPHWNHGNPFVLPSPRRGMLLTLPPNATMERLTSDSERCCRSTARRSRRRICAMSTHLRCAIGGAAASFRRRCRAAPPGCYDAGGGGGGAAGHRTAL